MLSSPIVNITGERVALGPMRADLVDTYERWNNDFHIQSMFAAYIRGFLAPRAVLCHDFVTSCAGCNPSWDSFLNFLYR